MSSIACVLRRRGDLAQTDIIGKMLDALAFRAPDGRYAHVAGPIGLGIGLLATASDGLVVKPDGLAISLDGRLDHVAALAEVLGLDRSTSNTELILAGYRRWGQEVLQRLEGDFAFALWDPSTSRLLVGRDPLGVRPVYYHASAEALWVASHPAAIAAAVPAVLRSIDRGVAAAFAVGLAWPMDRTAYPAIKRLPPGSLLIASQGAVVEERWFEWRIGRRRTGEDPPERFAELLSDAVKEQSRTTKRLGALLSGGLDSSSIVALAVRNQGGQPGSLLRTYSQVFPSSPSGDERFYMDAIIAKGGVDPMFVQEEDIAPFTGYPSLLDGQFFPVIAPNIATMHHTLTVAARDGVRVLLDGHGGDETVSHGIRWLRDLAYRLRAVAVWRAVRPYAAANGHSAARMFKITMRRYGPWRAQRPNTHPSCAYLAAGCQPLLAEEPAHLFGDESRTGHLADVVGPYSVLANETSNHLASACGIELRFPMLDRRLIEWCIAAPGNEKFGEGHSRLLLRKGMVGIVPDAVRWRGDKHDFSGQVARGLVRDTGVVEQALADRDGRLRQFFNLPVLSEYWQAVRNMPSDLGGSYVQPLWRAVLLSQWLERHGGDLTEGA